MADREDVNELELLMDIQQRLTRVEANTSGVSDTMKLADKAYTLSKQNEADVNKLQENSQWWSRTMWVAIILPVVLFLIESFWLK